MPTKVSKKKVLLVDLGVSMGGVEAYLVALAKILAANTDVYALCVMTELQQPLVQCGVHVTRIPVFSRVRLVRFGAAIITMTYLLIRYNIDVVQLNGFFESILVIPARLLGRATVYTRHGPFEIDLFPWHKHPIKYVPRMLSRYISHLSSKVICVSESVGLLYAPLFPEGRVTVIPNWVTTLPSPRRFPAAEKAKVIRIVCMGRLEKYKGVQLLLDAARGLNNIAVTIVGDGSYRQELEKLAAGLEVEFVGFHRDPTPFYQKADIFVMPSFGPEGLPMVALEAMSHMLPCLFSDLPVHCEITENGRAAMLFRCGDTHDLKDKLKLLLDNDDERRRLATNAYDIVKRKYHEPVARQAYLHVFSAV